MEAGSGDVEDGIGIGKQKLSMKWKLEAEIEYEMEAGSVDVEDGIGIWKQS